MNRCIHCTRCIRFTQEITGTSELALPPRVQEAHQPGHLVADGEDLRRLGMRDEGDELAFIPPVAGG